MFGLTRKTRATLAVPVLLTVGILLSLAAFFYLRASDRAIEAARFERRVARVYDIMQERIDGHILLLNALRGVFADVFARPASLTRAQLTEAMEPVRTLMPSLHSVGWVRRTGAAASPSLEQVMRADGMPGFTVHDLGGGRPQAGGGNLFVTMVTESFEAGAPDAGLNVASLPGHLDALNYACRTNGMALADMSSLSGHDGQRRGYAVYIPVAPGLIPPGDAQDPCASVAGFMMAIFHVEPLVDEVFDRQRPSPGDLYVIDRSAPEGRRILAARSADERDFVPLSEQELAAMPVLQRDMPVGGRQWQLVLVPFEATAAAGHPWAVLVVGLMLTGMLAGYVRREEQAKRLLQTEARARAAMARALRESEERFRLALRHSRISLCSHDLSLRYVWIYNPQLPIPPEAFLGRTDAEMFGSKNAALLDAIKRPVLDTGIGVRQEVRLLLDGQAVVFDLVVEPLRDEDERISGVICAAIDLTEAYRIREAMALAQAEAERANQAKSRFLAAASHDLRQPFQAMGLFHHILTTTLTSPQQREVAGKLGEALEAGNTLLATLLDTSALEAGTVKPRFVEFAFQTIAERLTNEIAGQASAKGLEFRTVSCGAQVRSDPVLLERMLRNLLVNALRYTTRGRILLGCRRLGDRLSVEVWDTGPGIPQNQLERIFEDFYRCATDGRDSARGLGLGLSIVRRMSQILDHPVLVRSIEGRGTVFSVSVPIVADPPRQGGGPLPAPAAVSA